eukprot:1331379-Amorphochlora_amoeboformis.AAC.1
MRKSLKQSLALFKPHNQSPLWQRDDIVHYIQAIYPVQLEHSVDLQLSPAHCQAAIVVAKSQLAATRYGRLVNCQRLH